MTSLGCCKLATVLVACTLLPSAMAAQKSSLYGTKSDDCGGVHRPGDRITCYVTFASSTDFTDLQVQFNVPDDQKPRAHGSYLNFILGDTKKINPQTYAVSGVVGNCVPGTYKLATVSARTRNDAQLYSNVGDLSIVIENDSGDAAANLKADQTRLKMLASMVPHIIENPPPDATVFPKILWIRPAPAAAPPIVDLVTLFGRLLHKPDSCGGKRKQGETITCRIQCQGNPLFQTVGFSFHRYGTKATLYQSQECGGFSVATPQHAAPLAPGLYEVKGPIPRCSSDKYRITWVTAFGYSAGESTNLYVHNYRRGRDFSSSIVLHLQDTTRSEFPAVVKVASTPN